MCTEERLRQSRDSWLPAILWPGMTSKLLLMFRMPTRFQNREAELTRNSLNRTMRQQLQASRLMHICSHVSLVSRLLALADMVSGAGTHPGGVACKPVKTQLQEFNNLMSSNNVKIDRYWFDIEPTKKGVYGAACNGWDFSKQANEALAKEWVAAIKASGRNWGIYGNG